MSCTPLNSAPRRLSRDRCFKGFFFAVFALVASGCTSVFYPVSVVSKVGRPVAAVSYSLEVTGPLQENDPHLHQETAAAVKRMLSDHGFREAPSDGSAEMIVTLDYGVDRPEVRRETHRYATASTSGAGIATERVQAGTDAAGNAVSEERVSRVPAQVSWEGEKTFVSEKTVYETYLRLTARSNSRPVRVGREGELWSVAVTRESKQREANPDLSVLIAVSAENLGKNFVGQRRIWRNGSSVKTAAISQRSNATE